MNICVFCSSGEGINPVFMSSAFEIGKRLATRGDTIIHGGSVGGLMGKLTEGARLFRGKVVGVTCLQVRSVEPTSRDVQEVIETETLALRKRTMLEISDEFLILPGGFGTLDETSEMITLKQLGLISNPIGFININGYWDNFLKFIKTAEEEGMIITKDRDTYRVYDSIDSYFDLI